MKKVLVTGGVGFVGNCLVRKLLSARDCDVLVLDKLTYAANLDALADFRKCHRFKFKEGGIEDSEIVQRVFTEFQPTCVINCAAETHVDRSIRFPDAFVNTNVVGTTCLLDHALSYWDSLQETQQREFRFLQVSTDEVYGTLGSEGRFTEQSKFAPNSPYSASKAAADHFVRSYFQTYGLPVLTTHSSNNFGPYQHREKLIPLMIWHAIEGKPMPVYGDGSNVRDWIYVDDHCNALWDTVCKGTPGESYNIGASCEKTNLQVVRAICDQVEKALPNLQHAPLESLITFVEDRPGHDQRYAIDPSKLAKQLAWKPAYDFELGLETTVNWYIRRYLAGQGE